MRLPMQPRQPGGLDDSSALSISECFEAAYGLVSGTSKSAVPVQQLTSILNPPVAGDEVHIRGVSRSSLCFIMA